MQYVSAPQQAPQQFVSQFDFQQPQQQPQQQQQQQAPPQQQQPATAESAPSADGTEVRPVGPLARALHWPWHCCDALLWSLVLEHADGIQWQAGVAQSSAEPTGK